MSGDPLETATFDPEWARQVALSMACEAAQYALLTVQTMVADKGLDALFQPILGRLEELARDADARSERIEAIYAGEAGL